MNELEWLNDQRPDVREPDWSAARADLLAHIEAASRQDAAPRRAAPPRRPRARWRPRLAFLAVAGLVAAAMAVAWPTKGPAPGPGVIGPPEQAVAAPLVRLSQQIAQEPEPKGDATLVHRSHHFPDGKDFTGNDLYLDDGRYYFGATRKELKDAGLQSDVNDKLLDAAAKGDRAGVINATWGDEGKPEAAPPAEALADRKKILEAKGVDPATVRPLSQKTQDDNRAWFGSMDALLAGAGRADVRAGVMKILSEMPKVKVTETAETLALTQTDFTDGYEETLIIDAKTGVPVKFVGGTHGQEPSVVVDYEIKRVTAANWADAAA